MSAPSAVEGYQPLIAPVEFVSVKPQADATDEGRASVTFVVKGKTQQDAVMAAKSEETIRRGLHEVRVLGISGAGLSTQGVALPCDAEGKPFESLNIPEATDPNTVFYATITNTYLGAA